MQVIQDLARVLRLDLYRRPPLPGDVPSIQGSPFSGPFDIGGPPYGDDPIDQALITLGIMYYITKGAEPCGR